MAERPWEVGDQNQRWEGYLDLRYYDGEVGGHLLRNKVGATTFDGLRTAEDSRVEARMVTMPGFDIPGSYDLDGLKSIHRHLFQDVYEWAGDLRTVSLAKAGIPFAGPTDIPKVMEVVARQIAENDLFKSVPDKHVPEALAMTYHGLNFSHPFREGNGRTQRAFLSALAAESGHRLGWRAVQGERNDQASIAALTGDLKPMVEMFRDITQTVPQQDRRRPLSERIADRARSLTPRSRPDDPPRRQRDR